MTEVFVEHVNYTVSDAKGTAEMLCRLFDWKIRWSGKSISGGTSYHVGGKNSYVALYSNGGVIKAGNTYQTPSAMNHLGIVVPDLDMIEERVKAEGFTPHNHDDYEPGRRFYFYGPDRVEYEVVCYD